jgi:hypothetical protein
MFLSGLHHFGKLVKPLPFSIEQDRKKGEKKNKKREKLETLPDAEQKMDLLVVLDVHCFVGYGREAVRSRHLQLIEQGQGEKTKKQKKKRKKNFATTNLSLKWSAAGVSFSARHSSAT